MTETTADPQAAGVDRDAVGRPALRAGLHQGLAIIASRVSTSGSDRIHSASIGVIPTSASSRTRLRDDSDAT